MRRHKEAIARKKIRLDKRYILSNKRQENLSVVINDDNWQLLRLQNITSLGMFGNKKDWKVVSTLQDVYFYQNQNI